MDNKKLKELEANLWEAADDLRANSNLTSNEYCMPVLGLIFLRYAESRYEMAEKEILKELMNLSRTMSEEAQRYVRENFDNDEQLALYDLLFSDELSKQDIKEVKQMVRELYKKVTQMIAEYDHWKEKETTCAAIKSAIGDTILEVAPDVIYDKQERYQRLIYQYFYNNYQAV